MINWKIKREELNRVEKNQAEEWVKIERAKVEIADKQQRFEDNQKNYDKDQQSRSDSLEKELDLRLKSFQSNLEKMIRNSNEEITMLYENHNSLISVESQSAKETIDTLRETTKSILQNEKDQLNKEHQEKLNSISEYKRDLENQMTECRNRENKADSKFYDAESQIKIYKEFEAKLEQEFQARNEALEGRIQELEKLKTNEYETKKLDLKDSYIELRDVTTKLREEDKQVLESIYKSRIETSSQYIKSLGEDLSLKNQEINNLEYIKNMFKGNPENYIKLMEELKKDKLYLNKLLGDKSTELDRFKDIAPTPEELSTKLNYAEEIKEKYEREFTDFHMYKGKAKQLDILNETLALSKASGEDIKEEIILKKREVEDLRIENDLLNDKLKDKKIPREDRIKAIENPLVAINEGDEDHIRVKITDPEREIREEEFLKNIETGINKQGYRFEDRLLKAFHTSLKCADMAIITVLSGVSGTGKSTLGQLYSFYGGLIFNSTAVQPNWDSTEDLLGYYDPIGNSFNATEVLRLLYQSQHTSKDNLHIVLLDEMNLAHIELYYNQFLSKLEERRGTYEGAYIDVNLGSGEKSLQLELGDNVFWLGTMNQDETVKNLSGKVIDRGNNIFFPSPDEFMDSIKPAVKNDKAVLLNKVNWDEWKLKRYEIDFPLFDKLILAKKREFNDIHKVLVDLKRSLGHRGWQSIETYLCNYPGVKTLVLKLKDLEGNEDEYDSIKKDIKNIINIAFEDILAMKLFPRLSGADCSDDYKKELDQLKDLLPKGLIKDFENAIDNSFEIFEQVSSNYLSSRESK